MNTLPEGVTIEKVMQLLENEKKAKERHAKYLQTPAGKEHNRQKAQQYYEKHKEEVLAKRKARYEENPEKFIEATMKWYRKKKELENTPATTESPA